MDGYEKFKCSRVSQLPIPDLSLVKLAKFIVIKGVIDSIDQVILTRRLTAVEEDLLASGVKEVFRKSP